MRKNFARYQSIFAFIVALGISPIAAAIGDDYCLSTNHYCHQGAKSEPVEPADVDSPLTGGGALSGFTLNPAMIPVKGAFGIAAVYYKVRPSFLIVNGTGRIGAAVSPSNGDDTFFGNPAFETDADYLYRRQESLPFRQPKVALGAALSLYDNKEEGFKKFQIALGALGRYVVDSKKVKPGGGLNITTGPLRLGAAYSLDESHVSADGNEPEKIVKNEILSLTGGLAFGSLMADYTKLKLTPDAGTEKNVDLISLSMLIKRFTFTAAYRIEKSDRLAYDKTTRALYAKPMKEDVFGGVQFAIFSFAQIGVFHNYYLLEETSAGLTIFF